MENKIIDGKKIASEIEEKLKEKIKTLKRKPRLMAILIGYDPNSHKYINLKSAKARDLGIDFVTIMPREDIEFETIQNDIKHYNTHGYGGKIDGVLVQLPLPEIFLKDHKTEDLLKIIDSKKDVDGLTDKGEYLPAVVKAVMTIIKRLGSVEDKVFAVVGYKGWVGERVLKALEFRTPGIIKVDEGDDLNNLQVADVIISCTGKQNLIKGENIKDGAILIDVGLGDFDKSALKKSSQYTPKIGGVGPLTIISLMENVVESATRRIN